MDPGETDALGEVVQCCFPTAVMIPLYSTALRRPPGGPPCPSRSPPGSRPPFGPWAVHLVLGQALAPLAWGSIQEGGGQGPKVLYTDRLEVLYCRSRVEVLYSTVYSRLPAACTRLGGWWSYQAGWRRRVYRPGRGGGVQGGVSAGAPAPQQTTPHQPSRQPHTSPSRQPTSSTYCLK